jgi:hypothetical protein
MSCRVRCGRTLICNEKSLAMSGSEPTVPALSVNFMGTDS